MSASFAVCQKWLQACAWESELSHHQLVKYIAQNFLCTSRFTLYIVFSEVAFRIASIQDYIVRVQIPIKKSVVHQRPNFQPDRLTYSRVTFER